MAFQNITSIEYVKKIILFSSQNAKKKKTKYIYKYFFLKYLSKHTSVVRGFSNYFQCFSTLKLLKIIKITYFMIDNKKKIIDNK